MSQNPATRSPLFGASRARPSIRADGPTSRGAASTQSSAVCGATAGAGRSFDDDDDARR